MKVYIFQSTRARVDEVKLWGTKGGIRPQNIYLNFKRKSN